MTQVNAAAAGRFYGAGLMADRRWARLLRPPLRLLPDALHSRCAATLANHLLRGQPVRTRLAELEGRSLCLALADVPARLHLRVRHGRLVPADTAADVTIRGSLHDFAALALRLEDPDTLFFQRRLCLEGDTETGLHLKNLLDGMHYDWEAHVRAVLPAPLVRPALGAARRLRALGTALAAGRTPPV